MICFEHNDWSLEASNTIVSHNTDVEFITINRHRNVLETLRSKVYHKIAIILNPFFKSNQRIAAYASNDKTAQLLFRAKRYAAKHKLHRVIAHNMGSFYPALVIANSSNAKLQLDIEDYHPGEELYFNKKYDLQNRILVMQKAFTKANTITYASEGIKQKCKSVFSFSPQTKQAVIINAFKSGDFKQPEPNNAELNMVWFSQNISAKRGLETVFDLAKKHPEIKIHLVGNANHSFIETMNPSENIRIYKPMFQENLHNFLATMDIGLALENKTGDGNRDICLTNKIIAYAQAGLYIFATNTFGQSHFLKQIGSNFGAYYKSFT